MEYKTGWCVLTDTISGWELIWSTVEDDGEYTPQIFETERDAQLGIIEGIEEDISQFKTGQRKWEEILWPDEYLVAQIEIFEDGSIHVWEDGILEDIRHGILDTTLQEWRENR